MTSAPFALILAEGSIHMYMRDEVLIMNNVTIGPASRASMDRARTSAKCACVSITSMYFLPDQYPLPIERLRLTSPAAKQPKRPPLYSVSFVRLYGKKVVISTVISETHAARNLRSTTVSTVAVAQLPCRLE